jgi:hypothetical protein
MLEPAVTDGSKKLGLQEKVAEAGRVDPNITALLVDIWTGASVAFLAVGGGGGRFLGFEFVLGVVDKIFLIRHGDGFGYLSVERRMPVIVGFDCRQMVGSSR